MEEWCPIWLVTVRKKRSILPLVWGCWVPATMCLTPQAWRYFSNSPKPFFFPLALGPGVNGIELWAFVSDHPVITESGTPWISIACLRTSMLCLAVAF